MVSLEALIAERTGLKLRPRQRESSHRNVLLRLDALRLPEFEPYQSLLKEDTPEAQEEWDRLVVPLLNKESYFFRDKGQMTLLRDQILPELIERNRTTRTIRLWSAGCSTGEEAYSLAILVHEILAKSKSKVDERWDVRIYGTDIDDKALNAARQGSFGAWSFRMVDPKIRERYFSRQADGWQIDEVIRRSVEFSKCNLVKDSYRFGTSDVTKVDLILCRNVFIYFVPFAVAGVLKKFAQSLRDGGYLMTGHIETRERVPTSLRVRTFPESEVYQRSMPEDPAVTYQPQTLHSVPRVNAKLEVNLPSAKSDFKIETRPTLPVQDAQIAESNLTRARALADIGHYESAIEACVLHLNLFPLAYEPIELLSIIALEQGRNEDGKILLKKAIYLSPSSPHLYIELGKLYQSEGDENRAGKMFKTALELLEAMPSTAQVGFDPAIVDTATVSEYVAHLRKITPGGG